VAFLAVAVRRQHFSFSFIRVRSLVPPPPAFVLFAVLAVQRVVFLWYWRRLPCRRRLGRSEPNIEKDVLGEKCLMDRDITNGNVSVVLGSTRELLLGGGFKFCLGI
jgi:membrane protein implicated in regulation of membrane protease activity